MDRRQKKRQAEGTGTRWTAWFQTWVTVHMVVIADIENTGGDADWTRKNRKFSI